MQSNGNEFRREGGFVHFGHSHRCFWLLIADCCNVEPPSCGKFGLVMLSWIRASRERWKRFVAGPTYKMRAVVQLRPLPSRAERRRKIAPETEICSSIAAHNVCFTGIKSLFLKPALRKVWRPQRQGWASFTHHVNTRRLDCGRIMTNFNIVILISRNVQCECRMV